MPTFDVVALDRENSRVERAVDADSELTARSLLSSEGLIPVSVDRRDETGKLNRDFHLRSQKPKAADLSQFANDLATRLSSGVDLPKSLSRLADQRKGTPLGDALEDINRRLRTAENVYLPDAFRVHEDIFGTLFCSLFAAGYKSGRLAEEMDEAAALLADRDQLSRKVTSALVAPGILVGVTILVVFLMTILVVPAYKRLFTTFGSHLPAITESLIGVEGAVTHYWYLLVVGVAAAVAGAKIALGDERSRRKIDAALLRIPKFGDLFAMSAMYRMSSTLLGMLLADVDTFEALYFSADTAGNMVYRDGLRQVADLMRDEALPISAATRRVGIFPSLFVDAIENGETSGRLADTLKKYVSRSGVELRTATERFQETVQPVVNLVVYAIIGVVIVALAAPEYSLIGAAAKAAGG